MLQFIVSMVLYFIMFFGISFILNMLLRKTWFMSFVYPVIILIIIDGISTVEYFKNPTAAFKTAFAALIQISFIDIIALGSGFVGTIVAGIVIKILRKSGYQMF